MKVGLIPKKEEVKDISTILLFAHLFCSCNLKTDKNKLEPKMNLNLNLFLILLIEFCIDFLQIYKCILKI